MNRIIEFNQDYDAIKIKIRFLHKKNTVSKKRVSEMYENFS